MKKTIKVIKKILLKSDFAKGQSIKKIDEAENLFDCGMDSISFVSFLVALENKFNITFEIEELYYENLNTLNKIAKACEKKTGAEE